VFIREICLPVETIVKI